MRKFFGGALVVAIILGGGAAYYYFTRYAIAVTVAEPMRGPAVRAVYATGTVEPVRWAKVASTIPGRIADIRVREGEAVQAGQVLAKLDDREARARVAELEAKVIYWRGEVGRLTPLVERSFVSRDTFERAQMEQNQARAAVDAARQRLSDFELLAPMAGVVLRKDGEIGEVLAVGQGLLSVGQPKPLWITADVDEEDIPLVKPGLRTLIKADAFPATLLEGKVGDITPKGDPVNKSYRVRINLPDDTPLMIGMTTEINIVIGVEENAILVPAAAVVGGRVWIAEDGFARSVGVQTGIAGEGRIQIVKGLSGGERIIVDPPRTLADGTRLRPRPAPEAQK